MGRRGFGAHGRAIVGSALAVAVAGTQCRNFEGTVPMHGSGGQAGASTGGVAGTAVDSPGGHNDFDAGTGGASSVGEGGSNPSGGKRPSGRAGAVGITGEDPSAPGEPGAAGASGEGGAAEAPEPGVSGAVRIFIDGRPVCGGTLLTNAWVLTADHCLPSGTAPSAVEVRFGMNSDDPLEVRHGLELVRYPGNQGDTRVRDLALLGVDAPFEIDGSTSRHYMELFSYPGDALLVAVRCVGWDMDPDPSSPTNELKTAELTPVLYQTRADGVVVWWDNTNLLDPENGTLLMPADDGSACFFQQGNSTFVSTVHVGDPKELREGGANAGEEAYSLSVAEVATHSWITDVLLGAMPDSHIDDLDGVVSACSPEPDTVELFARSVGGELSVYERRADGSAWASSPARWQKEVALELPQGVTLSKNRPGVRCAADGSSDLVITGDDGSAWWQHRDPSSGWAPGFAHVSTATMPLTSGLSLVGLESGTFHVFGRGSDGSLQHGIYAGAWSEPWETFVPSFPIDGSPSALEPNRDWLDVFMRTPRQTLSEYSWRQEPASPYSLSDSSDSEPVVTSWSEDHVDLFARDAAGRLTRFTRDTYWYPWASNTQGFLQRGELSAVAREEGSFDLFVSPSGSSSSLVHLVWPRPPGADRPPAGDGIPAIWNDDIGEFGVPGPQVAGALDIAVAPRSDIAIALVTSDSQHQVQVYENDTPEGWGSITLPPPSGHEFLAVAATSHNGTLDIIAATTNGENKLYYAHSPGGDWPLVFSDWTEVVGAEPVGNPGQVALSGWGDTLHAFWITTTGNIGHASGTGDLSELESGDVDGTTYLQPLIPSTGLSLDAVSWGEGRLDLVMGHVSNGSNGAMLEHHYFDAQDGGWGSAPSWHRETRALTKADGTSFNLQPLDFALLSATSNAFEIVTLDPASGLSTPTFYRSTFDGSSGWSTANATQVDAPIAFETVNTSRAPSSGPMSGGFWPGNRGVFSATGTSVWQMVY
jgi:hypothetical protein